MSRHIVKVVMTKVFMSASLATVLALPLAGGPALAQATGAEGAVPNQDALAAMVRALAVADPSVISNRDFTVNPDLAGKEGSYGGAIGPLGSGTETFPPGANGAEAAGSSANGSTMGGFGG